MATHHRDRAVALSLQLAQAHQELRGRGNGYDADWSGHVFRFEPVGEGQNSV